MSKVPISEPVAYRSKDQPYLFGLSAPTGSSERWDGLITTTQAEAYADARVREVLEQAYLEVRQLEKDLVVDAPHAGGPQAASFAANQIRALIPPSRSG